MAETPEFVLGMDGVLYYGDTDDAIAEMAPLTNVKDLTINTERSKADVSTRANAGWRGTIGALADLSLEWEMQWKPGDEGFEAIRDAYLGNTTLELAALSGAYDGTNSEGPKGSFSITQFSRSEPLEESMKVSVRADLAVWHEWYNSASS